MPLIRGIFFDWGGVIADDPGDEFLGQLLRDIGANEQQAQEIYTTYMRRFMRGELSESDYWQAIRQNYGLDFHDSISDEFKKWRGLIVNDSILELADIAKAKGYKTAILSNVIEPTYNVLLASGHFKRFDTVIASCQVGFAKPQVEIYEIALRQLGVSAEQSLFIDDKPKNLEPATQLGFKTVLARNPEQIIQDISAYLR